MTFLIIYSLVIYFIYHVVARSDLLALPRQWLVARAPGWLTYPIQCAFCMAFWIGASLTAGDLLTTGTLTLNPVILCGAPVLCYLIGLLSSVAHRYLDLTEPFDPLYMESTPLTAAEPPVPIEAGSGPTYPTSIDSISYLRKRNLEDDPDETDDDQETATQPPQINP